MTIKELQNAINNLDENQIDELIKGINYSNKDAIYRRLWFDYIKEDVIQQSKINPDIKLTEEQINNCANRYVYDCDYDCEIPYWDNIDMLIYDEWEKSKNK